MTQKDAGFDAFFEAVTTTPEFKKVVQKDWSGDFSETLKKMEASVAKAGDITKAFHETFATPESIDAGNNISTHSSDTSGKSAKNAGDDEARKLIVEPEYFVMKNPDTWGFKGVAGMQKLKEELTDGFIKPLQFLFLVRNLKEKYDLMSETEIDTKEEKKEKMLVDLYASYEAFQVGIPTGMLLYGPPGTGKTFITKKLAQELGAGLITKSVGEFGSSYLHETSKNIREFFAAAKLASEKGPIILFLDEIDSLVSKRDNKVDANKAEEVSQFLQEFNKLEEAPNLIVIAATNRPDHLDSAILRSGRLDKKYYIGAPDTEARKELFEIFIAKQKRPHGKLNYSKLAEFTDGYVAADIEAIVEEASRDASKNIIELAEKIQAHDGDISDFKDALQNHEITQGLLEIAISETTPSLKMVDMSVFENWEKTIDT
ncbi:ATP-binding protein [Candidatus Gracilibacteria bacterium]|nr:ATP-binding protein [Candidatus Gracilibacteria bacterium]